MRYQSCKKIIFVRYPDFQWENVRFIYLVNFVTIWGIKVIIRLFQLIYSHLDFNCVIYLHECILFKLRLMATIWKCLNCFWERCGMLNYNQKRHGRSKSGTCVQFWGILFFLFISLFFQCWLFSISSFLFHFILISINS